MSIFKYAITNTFWRAERAYTLWSECIYIHVSFQCACILAQCANISSLASSAHLQLHSIPLAVSIFMMYIQVGDSALIEAARWGKTGVVKDLMKGGAQLNLQNNVCQ